MLHVIFQRHGIMPDKILALPDGVRAFLFASTIVQLEDERDARQHAKKKR